MSQTVVSLGELARDLGGDLVLLGIVGVAVGMILQQELAVCPANLFEIRPRLELERSVPPLSIGGWIARRLTTHAGSVACVLVRPFPGLLGRILDATSASTGFRADRLLGLLLDLFLRLRFLRGQQIAQPIPVGRLPKIGEVGARQVHETLSDGHRFSPFAETSGSSSSTISASTGRRATSVFELSSSSS